MELQVSLRQPHTHQLDFINSTAPRKVIRAGRRGGKTVGVAVLAVQRFLEGRRVLYAAPTADQLQAFWFEVKRALAEPLDAGVFYKNETDHVIEVPGTKQRIRAKTAYNADTLRGDYADELILDEYQLMNENAWGIVGAPMLLDNNGSATFVYTPPSLHSRSVTKADDPQHAAKFYKKAKADTTGRWATFHFSSRENPHISATAIDEMAEDMTALAYRMEIEAEDVEEAPGALWTRALLQNGRVSPADAYDRIVVAIDPSASSTGDEAGIIGAGKRGREGDVLRDVSVQGSPMTWATAAVGLYRDLEADCIVAESNNGGEMISQTIATVDSAIRVRLVHATRNKQTRAEPVASIFEHGRGHLAGTFNKLEDEMCLWTPGDKSPNRMDAMVWAFTELGLAKGREWKVY